MVLIPWIGPIYLYELVFNVWPQPRMSKRDSNVFGEVEKFES